MRKPPTDSELDLIIAVLVGVSVALGIIFATLTARGAEKDKPTGAALRAAQQLGYELYWDPYVLSASGKVSCATCHIPDKHFAYSDGRKLAVPVGAVNAGGLNTGPLGIRHTRTLIGIAGREDKELNSDGRTKGLVAMCFQAVTDPNVMNSNIADVVAKANQSARYRELSRVAFGTPEITEQILRSAMVYHLRRIQSPDLPADRLAAGLDVVLPDSAKRGWKVFQANCTVCHDPQDDWRSDGYYDIGISARSQNNDTGRGAVTLNPADNFKFAVPTLRECGKRTHFMHDGSLEALDDVAGYFAAGGRYRLGDQILRGTSIDPLVARIDLTKDEAADLKNFLELGFQGDHYPDFPDPKKASP